MWRYPCSATGCSVQSQAIQRSLLAFLLVYRSPPAGLFELGGRTGRSSVCRGFSGGHLSLTFAVVICVISIPRRFFQIRRDLWNHLQFYRLTRRGLFFVSIILIVGFSTLNTGNNLLILILSFLLASLIVSGIIANVVLQGLRISLKIPDAIHAGQKAVFFLTLHNLKKFFPSFALKLKGKEKAHSKVEQRNFSVQEKNFPYIRGGDKLRLDLHCEFNRRGAYSMDGFEVSTSFPFGFFLRARKLRARGSIVVCPELCDLSPLFVHYPFLQGIKERRRKGPGSTLHNIREYQTGDSTRFVHWKSTAKMARLMVKDFEDEGDNPLDIVFSTYLPEHSPAALRQFEKVVSCLASLGRHYHGIGQEFDFNSGEFGVRVNGQNEQYQAFMEYLARVQPSDHLQTNPDRLRETTILFAAGNSVMPEEAYRIDYMTF